MRFSPKSLLGGGLAIAAVAVAAGTFASVTAAPQRLPANPVRVSVQALGQDRVEVVVTNASRKTLRIPKWQLPSAAFDSNLFRISREGEEVRFHGRMIKRAAPTMSDFAVLRPGQSQRSVIELGKMYDLSKPGLYTVTYATSLQYASLSGGPQLRAGNGAPLVAQAAPIRISLDRAIAAGSRVKPVLPANPTLSDVVGISTVGCSSTQISQINQAVLSARSYSENSKGYLNGGATGARYTSWFGAYTSDRYNTVKQHFVEIDKAMDQTGGQVTINCGCASSAFAYVYSNQPYQIWVCNAFWSAPLIGTDSRAGTLIHEMSHFTIVAGTDDHVYGQAGARNLANTNPTNAADNADNHEYFAENTPFEN